ncbi:MAG: sigma 54-interacting transcriptional regulator, partial [Bacteroidota bacterium]
MEKISALSQFTIAKMSDEVFWLDQEGKFFWVNQAACDALGYRPEELSKMSVFDINPNMNLERWTTHWREQTQQNEPVEVMHQRKDGKLFPVEIVNNFIQYEGKTYSCAIVRDITERKHKESALRGALLEIRELKERLEEENNYLQEEIKLGQNFGEIITQSEAFKSVLVEIEQVAETNSTVLITGESGTGKELIARSIQKLSRRCNRPLIKINCAALPAHLIESELFGHEKGAFTGALQKKKGRFELADGGTLFLDEIGEMPIELQPKLLRVLQEGAFEPVGSGQTIKVDVRILAATNRDLQKEVEKGRFREDLFYRLHVFPIHCIPLRDRKEDIPLLMRHFCKKFEAKIGKSITNIPQKVIKQLQDYDFPGNIRELENFVERAIILSKNGKLELGNWIPKTTPKHLPKRILTLEELQKRHIIETLQHTNWRISGEKGAAKLLGIKPTTLESRMKKLGIRR